MRFAIVSSILGLGLLGCSHEGAMTYYNEAPAQTRAPGIALRGAIPEADRAFAVPAPKPAVAHVLPAHAAVTTLVMTERGKDLIRAQEGLRLDAYRGPSGRWLIGYGHAGTARPGMSISFEEAEALLVRDLQEHEDNIFRVVKVPINPNELSAMVSLSYTIGISAFAKSTLVRRLNDGDRPGAADAFLMWNKITRNGVRRENAYLTRRREKERALFMAPFGNTIETASTALDHP